MTKNDWLQICRLNQEWYFRSIGLGGDQIEKHMPGDDIFDDGRIEFFQERFRQEEINPEELDRIARKETGCLNPDDPSDPNYTGYHCFVAGYKMRLP